MGGINILTVNTIQFNGIILLVMLHLFGII